MSRGDIIFQKKQGANNSWGSISVVLFGVPLVGIVSIEYKKKQAKTNNYGAGTDYQTQAFNTNLI
jgi:hypothetical protein